MTDKGENTVWVRLVLDVPLDTEFDYRAPAAIGVGTRVIVPFGRRKLIGVVVGQPSEPAVDPDQVRDVEEVLDDLPPLPEDWLRLARFAARYYQRPLGEVILPALPSSLRKVGAYRGKRSAGGPVQRLLRRPEPAVAPPDPLPAPELTPEQCAATDVLKGLAGYHAVVLHGVTGSGKTEVYLQMALDVLAQGRQILFLVPEINLTPQLERFLASRLSGIGRPVRLAVLHSGLSEGERLRAWLRAQGGEADVLLGTRLAIFTPLPRLGLIIVDEEHDGSYKQQDGLRYSARDLAVWRAHDLDIPVVLGSATPSFETWHHVIAGRYRRLVLQHRARQVALPTVRLVDTRRLRLEQGFSPQLMEAVAARLLKGEQSLIFLNRRGYAPVLSCLACGWLTRCPRCSTYTVLHGRVHGRNRLQCHHCGYQARAPGHCPDCGNQDLTPMGRGTQRVEETLQACHPEARIARIDADTTRLKGSAAELFARVHAGDIDILVGTQMVAKGHDFARLGLVGVLGADAMLFAHDFRAPERLFAQLMQVAGRAGRHAEGAEVIIQTDYPDQPVYQAVMRHDYEGFAEYGLSEREALSLPPYAFQALLTAEAGDVQAALDFLSAARRFPLDRPQDYPDLRHIALYDPVPLRVVRVAHVERAQLLVESRQRPVLQSFLARWSRDIQELVRAARVRCHLEVDPAEI